MKDVSPWLMIQLPILCNLSSQPAAAAAAASLHLQSEPALLYRAPAPWLPPPTRTHTHTHKEAQEYVMKSSDKEIQGRDFLL